MRTKRIGGISLVLAIMIAMLVVFNSPVPVLAMDWASAPEADPAPTGGELDPAPTGGELEPAPTGGEVPPEPEVDPVPVPDEDPVPVPDEDPVPVPEVDPPVSVPGKG